MKGPCWMTIQGEAEKNLHVFARTRVLLPPGNWVLRLSADDYYHAWLDGEWLGQGPAPGVPEAYWYQEYPVDGGREATLAYNGPHNSDHGWQKDREHGRISESKERGNEP